MWKKLLIGIIVIVIFVSSAYLAYQDREIRFQVGTLIGIKPDPTSSNIDIQIEPFLTGLERPTSMIFLGEDILFLEKETGIVRLVNNGIIRSEPVLDLNVSHRYEGGLLGIAAIDSTVFLYFTESETDGGEPIADRVYKYDWDENYLINPILVNSFDVTSIAHHGGAMITQNDSVLLVRGDQRAGDVADKNWGSLQNDEQLLIDDTSVIIRVGLDENVITPSESSNPLDHYYAIGIRNSFGMAIDPVTGNLWMTENGEDEFDEINMIYPKFNSGWSKIMGPANETQIANLPEFGEFIYSDPEFSWEITVAPTALIFANPDWPEAFQDTVFVGDCRGNLLNFKLNSDRTGFVFSSPELKDNIANVEDSIEEILIASDFKCITDFDYGPDGSLYVVSHQDNGAIYKIKPKE